MDPLPIACSLTEAQVAERRSTLLPGLRSRATSTDVLPNGVRWSFSPTDDLLGEIAAVIDAERRCCQFLRFELTVEPGAGPVRLTVTGPEGTAHFLGELLSQ